MSAADDELKRLFTTAIDDWKAQGRPAEQKYALDNFMSGRGLRLLDELSQWADKRAARREADISGLAMQYMTPDRAQDFKNHLNISFQDDPRLKALTAEAEKGTTR